MNSTRWALGALLLVSCAETAKSGRSAGDQKSEAPMPTVRNRCTSGTCGCRPADTQGESMEGGGASEGAVPPGHKRIELRTGRGLDPQVIRIDGLGKLQKATDRAEPTCGYLDLAPGKYHVRLRAEAQNPDIGTVPALFV